MFKLVAQAIRLPKVINCSQDSREQVLLHFLGVDHCIQKYELRFVTLVDGEMQVHYLCHFTTQQSAFSRPL